MADPQHLAGLRQEYRKASFDAADAGTDPLVLFQRWFDEAERAGVEEPNAMTLATADAEGRPHARVVLLKGLENGAFQFFTNYDSAKGAELAARPYAALVFLWKELERQVRVEGRVQRLSPAESDAYFSVRPRGSQLGAWASPQSDAVPDREALEQRYARVEQEFEGRDVPRPPHWGGYAILPERLEFWQGRPSRLHDRIRFEPAAGGGWAKTRLAP